MFLALPDFIKNRELLVFLLDFNGDRLLLSELSCKHEHFAFSPTLAKERAL